MSQCSAILAEDHRKRVIYNFVTKRSEQAGLGLLSKPPPSTDEMVRIAKEILAIKKISKQLKESELLILESAIDYFTTKSINDHADS